MSAQEVIEQIKHLPPAERAQVAKFVVENDDSWIPESFKRGMADAEFYPFRAGIPETSLDYENKTVIPK